MDERKALAVPVDEMREKVARLENIMLEAVKADPAIQPVMPVTHHFADGLYGRELFIPAGTLIVGKVHKREHLNFLMQGEITVWTENGMKLLKAPCILKSYPGIKRVGLAHTDTIWVTVHATDAVEGCDIDELEDELTVPTLADYDALLDGEARMLLGGVAL